METNHSLKRGLAYQCASCNFKGEKRRVMGHVFEQHLTVEEFPYVCDVCDFACHDPAKFRKHSKWYAPHIKVTGSSELMVLSQPRPESMVVHTLMTTLSKEDSLHFWESRRRAPKPEPATPKPTCTAINQEKVPDVPGLRKLLPKPNPPKVAFSKDETELLGEFLCLDDINYGELDLDLAEKKTEEKGTMTDGGFFSLQRRLREQEEEILRLRKLLSDHGIDSEEGIRSTHKGEGAGERPQVSKRPETPLRPKLQSVAYQMPRQRPRPRERRPLKESDLFHPDTPRSRSRSSHLRV